MIKAEDSQLSGCKFESRNCILDECKRCQLASYYTFKITQTKVAKWGTPEKVFKQKIRERKKERKRERKKQRDRDR